MSVRNVLIIDGDPKPDGAVARRAVELEGVLKGRAPRVRRLALRDMKLRTCTGCFGCWVRTPGECVAADGTGDLLRETMAADFVLLASPLVAGFPTALLKRAVDKMIPIVHPYAAFTAGEIHHRARYGRYPRFGLLLAPGKDDALGDVEVVARIFARTALNFHSTLDFVRLADDPLDEVVALALGRGGRPLPSAAPRGPSRATWERIAPPREVVLINGSPRGRGGNTELLLGKLAEGFRSVAGRSVAEYRLAGGREAPLAALKFGAAECALVGFPLYTDSMPAIVKEFIERVARPGEKAPALGFVVQCGFPEANNLRPLELYLERLAKRLRAPYLGTIARADGEGIRVMPGSMTAPLFARMAGLGKGLAEGGALDRKIAADVAGRERLPWTLRALFLALGWTGLPNRHWNMMLKQHGTFGTSFARPYERAAAG